MITRKSLWDEDWIFGIRRGYIDIAEANPLFRTCQGFFMKIIEKVRGLLGKEREMYICPDGHKNDLEIKYCQYRMNGSPCDLNIKGFNKKESYKIKLFKLKIQSLKELMRSN